MIAPNLSNTQETVIDLLKTLKIKVHKKRIIEEVSNHPKFPSLLAVSDCFKNWKLKNETYLYDKNEFNKEDISYPFIAHSKIAGDEIFIVHSITDKYVKVGSKKKQITYKEFIDKWSGVAMEVTSDPESGSSYYKDDLTLNLLQKTKILLLVLIIGYFGLNLTNIRFEISLISMIALKTIGLLSCILIFVNSLDGKNSFLKSICTIGKVGDCGNILNSSASKINKWLSWADLGCIYFSGGIITLLFFPLNSAIAFTLVPFALFFTLYSIGFQIKKKSFCLLCTIVQIVFILECTLLILSEHFWVTVKNFSLYNLQLDGAILAYVIPAIVLSFIEDFLKNKQKAEVNSALLKKIKFDPNYLNYTLSKEKELVLTDKVNPFIIGNLNAETTLTVVSNPYCSPCAKAHKIIDTWLTHNKNIKVEIIFATGGSKNNESYQFLLHLLGIAESYDSKDTEVAIATWFGLQNYSEWSRLYPLPKDILNTRRIDEFDEWCSLNKINSTPTVFVNNRELPENYNLDDLKYILY